MALTDTIKAKAISVAVNKAFDMLYDDFDGNLPKVESLINKFAGSGDPVSENGLRYLDEVANTLLSAKVEQVIDCGTHVLFIAEVTETKKLNTVPSMTYSYYHANVKPKKKAEEKPKRGYVCRICGYFHEGEELPEDFICPLCKHGAADFEPVGF